MVRITVIGGGLAGLTAAIGCAERGARVVLHEAHGALGGRARTTSGPYKANDGVHAFYDGGPWRWLAARGLAHPHARMGAAELAGLRFRHGARLRRVPPPALIRMITFGRFRTAPVDASFHDWACTAFGPEAYRAAAGMLGPALYDADPGRLSAAFVFERLRRVTAPSLPPATRYPVGGWGTVIGRMADRARALGVRIETGSRVTALPEDGPVIIATSLPAARPLLGTDLRWDSGRAVLVDLAVERERGDLFCAFDLDEGGFAERFTCQDRTLAPAGRSLVQAAMPLRDDEAAADALARLDRLCDLLVPGHHDRLHWRRHQTAHHRTGALDLPGRTWRDRPPIDRGDDRYLVGDMVAAPGFLGEVSINSALKAARLATQAGRPLFA